MTSAISRRSISLLLAMTAAASVYLVSATMSGALPATLVLATDWLSYFVLPWSVLAPLLLIATDKFLHLPVYGNANVRFCVAAGVLLLVAHALLVKLVLTLRVRVDPTLMQTAPGLSSLLFDQGFLLLDLLVFAAVMAAAALRLQQLQLQRSEEDAYRLGRHLTDSRLQNLSMQLNPHFLFNTLNGVSVLIDKQDNERASEMVGELSKFLRQVLRTTREKWVTLEQELDFIRQYLRIEQYRFGKRLTCFEDCEPLALTARIPPMLLQPLFENAIVHGLADKQGECRLAFECRLYDRFLILYVFDNGDSPDELRDTAPKGGIGLSNIRARLRELYGDSYSLTIEKKSDGTLVTLKLPAFKDSQFRQTPE